uniref:BED-type domain-containing protein n=1 Tax=Heterorhabditis bacteriophora TaxID=37862 RepID=A0A1I7W7S2_HETBA
MPPVEEAFHCNYCLHSRKKKDLMDGVNQNPDCMNHLKFGSRQDMRRLCTSSEKFCIISHIKQGIKTALTVCNILYDICIFIEFVVQKSLTSTELTSSYISIQNISTEVYIC